MHTLNQTYQLLEEANEDWRRPPRTGGGTGGGHRGLEEATENWRRLNKGTREGSTNWSNMQNPKRGVLLSQPKNLDTGT